MRDIDCGNACAGTGSRHGEGIRTAGWEARLTGADLRAAAEPINQRTEAMTFWRLIRRSLQFHARSHLGVLLGAVVGSAALIGALLVGDSVRGSLRRMALARLGNVDVALSAGDRSFRDALAK